MGKDLADAYDQGEQVNAIDLAKTFGLVNHRILIRKIKKKTGLDSRVVLWIRAFTSGRTQRIKVGNQFSESIKVPSGVPQGNVIAALLKSNKSSFSK